MKKIKQLLTGLSLVLAFTVLVVKANFYVYQLSETGGPRMGPWFVFVGTVTSPQGGSIALAPGGQSILIENRTWWPTYPTTISNSPPGGGGMCDPSPCKEEF